MAASTTAAASVTFLLPASSYFPSSSTSPPCPIVSFPCLPSLLSLHNNIVPTVKRPTLCARSRRDLGVISGYGLPSYGAPQPYQTPSSPSDFVSPKSPTVGGQRGGNNKNPGFWNYGAPTNYSVPVDYKAPVKYGSPAAYGQGVGVVEEIKGTELGEEGATLDQVKELEKDAGGGGAGGGNSGSGGGGGQGGGGGDGGNEGGDDGDAKKKMSMSQKLTLAYAILVGVGGVIGFAKTGSSKSLMAGGGSASILYYVYLNLPSNPVLASTVGLGISVLLLFVMGSRYKNSGKVFPAGVVSLFSLIMSGGYIHGIMRTSHA